MRFSRYLKEDKIQSALELPEPKVGEKYPSEKVARYIKIIDAAISAMTKKEENDTNDSIMADLRDKKKKWKNVKSETKPTKTKQELPPDQEEEPPPDQEEEEDGRLPSERI